MMIVALSFGIGSAMGLVVLLAALRAGTRAELAEGPPGPADSLVGGEAALPRLRRIA